MRQDWSAGVAGDRREVFVFEIGKEVFRRVGEVGEEVDGVDPGGGAVGGVGGTDVEGFGEVVEGVEGAEDFADGGGEAGVEGEALEEVDDFGVVEEGGADEAGVEDAVAFDFVGGEGDELLADGDGLDVDDVLLGPDFGAEGNVECGVEGVLSFEGAVVGDGGEGSAGPGVEDFDLVHVIDGEEAEAGEVECGFEIGAGEGGCGGGVGGVGVGSDGGSEGGVGVGGGGGGFGGAALVHIDGEGGAGEEE